MSSGTVFLIGAGCGPMDLITVRGLERLRRCDAVVYDDLIDPALLDLAPPDAQRIYMGKRSGRHSAAQEDISDTLIRLASSGLRVARLKGGDPFVFGRGGEEALSLQAAGIPCEVIPGISSAIAIPGEAGIPVTHRQLSRSFHVVTAHTKDGALPEDLPQLAKLHGTLVFLMGLNRLAQITQALLRYGKAPDTPAAVISGGNAPYPQTIRGTLATVAKQAQLAELQPPAVIVIGETAGLVLPTGGTGGPLCGINVGLVGTDSLTGRLSAALREKGARPILTERSVVTPLPSVPELKTLCHGPCHWLVFTSANGVRLFFRRLREEKLDLRRLAHCKFAVIGKPTGEALAEYGVYPDLCPPVYTSQALGEALCTAVMPGEDVILLRAKEASPLLPELLRGRDIPLSDIALYTLTSDPSVTRRAAQQLSALHYLVFSSAGGVRLFLQEYGGIPQQAVCVCIGPVTAKALSAAADRPFLIAKTTDVDGLVQAILTHQGR